MSASHSCERAVALVLVVNEVAMNQSIQVRECGSLQSLKSLVLARFQSVHANFL